MGCHVQTPLRFQTPPPPRRTDVFLCESVSDGRRLDNLFCSLDALVFRSSAPRPRGRLRLNVSALRHSARLIYIPGSLRLACQGSVVFSFVLFAGWGEFFLIFLSFRPLSFCCFSSSQSITSLNPIIPQCATESERDPSHLQKMLHCRCYPIMHLHLGSSPRPPPPALPSLLGKLVEFV